MEKFYTTETFIEKAKKVHGNKYDYSKVVYINSQKKVSTSLYFLHAAVL